MTKNKNNKMILSMMLMCALVFGGIGFTQSQMNIAYAMPSVQVNSYTWHVSGRDSLQHDLQLVYLRNCPQGWGYARGIINRCINEGRTLVVTMGATTDGPAFYYAIK